MAKALRSRLADCEAAASVAELIVGSPTELADGTMSVELEAGSYLIFASNHSNAKVTADGRADWANVHSVRVLKIESQK